MLHLNLATLFALGLSFVAAPAAQWVAAQRDKTVAATAHLHAQAAAIKNPIERTLAEVGVQFAPAALNLAGVGLEALRGPVVSELTKVNPTAASVVGSLIDTALASPAPGAPATSTPAASTTPSA